MKALFSILICALSFITCRSQQNNTNNVILQNIKKSDTYSASVKRIPNLTLNAAPQTMARSKAMSANALSQKSSINNSIKSTPGLLTDTLTSYALQCTQSSLAANNKAAVKSNLYGRLQGWLNAPPPFTWTSSAIEQPKALGTIMLMLNDDMLKDKSNSQLSSDVKDINTGVSKYIRYSWNNGTDNSAFKNIGSDPLSETQRMGNVGYRVFGLASLAIIANDNGALDTISMIVKNQFNYVINKKNYYPVGIKSDGVIDQHNLGGSQIYNIGYGGDWLNDMVRYGQWFKNSKWQLTDKEYCRMADALVDGFQWMFYKNRAPYNIMGRHNSSIISPDYTPAYMDQRSNINYLMTAISDQSCRSYKALADYKQNLNNISRYNIDSSKYFWNSDLLIQSNDNYYVSIKMLSNKTGGVETGDVNNGEGINNFHMGDGSTILFRTGKEYDRARVAWNWRQIPGTTVKQKNGPLPLISYGQFSNSNNSVVGGVSDGKISIGTFYLDKQTKNSQTKATKSYFAFRDILVCMGNSIDDQDPGNDNSNIYTTINQCERMGDIVYALNGNSNNRTTVDKNNAVDISLNIDKPSWFWQDNIGYIIIPSSNGTKVRLSGNMKPGSWKKIDKTNPDVQDNVNIFLLAIDHGNRGRWLSKDYQYIVVPNTTVNQLTDLFNNVVNNKNLFSFVNQADKQIVAYNNYYCALFEKSNDAINSNWQDKKINITSNRKTAVILNNNNNKVLNVFSNRLDDEDATQGKLSIKISGGNSNQIFNESLSLNNGSTDDRFPVYKRFTF